MTTANHHPHSSRPTSPPWRSEGLECAAAGDPPWDWLPAAYTAFADHMSGGDVDHPCHFGVNGQQRGHNWFGAFDERLPHRFGLAALAGTLMTFREHAWRGPNRQSLVVFVGPPHTRPNLYSDHARFWDLLTELSACDELTWAANTPRDPRNPRWQWSFAGEPWFVFMGSPAYSSRRSRDLGPCLTLVFQVRRVFEGLSGETKAGIVAKQQIRAALGRYDDVPPHPHLGDSDHSSTYKWRQYALPDDNAVFPVDACPFPLDGSHGDGAG